MQQSISTLTPPISSGLAAAARFRNHTWSSGEILMPVTCCILHRLGKGFGQNGSTLYIGAPLASRACICRCCETATETMARTAAQDNTNAADFTRFDRFFVFIEIFPFLRSPSRGLHTRRLDPCNLRNPGLLVMEASRCVAQGR